MCSSSGRDSASSRRFSSFGSRVMPMSTSGDVWPPGTRHTCQHAATGTVTPVTTVDEWGIQQDWLDADDEPQRSPDATVARLRELIGQPPADLDQHAPVVTRPGRRTGLKGTVTCEDGSRGELDDIVPDDRSEEHTSE